MNFSHLASRLRLMLRSWICICCQFAHHNGNLPTVGNHLTWPPMLYCDRQTDGRTDGNVGNIYGLFHVFRAYHNIGDTKDILLGFCLFYCYGIDLRVAFMSIQSFLSVQEVMETVRGRPLTLKLPSGVFADPGRLLTSATAKRKMIWQRYIT